MPQITLQALLEYVWVPVVSGLVLLWSKIAGVNVRTTLLEQQQRHFDERRTEDRLMRDEQRREILDKIDSHHKTVMTKLDQVDKRVKNGR